MILINNMNRLKEKYIKEIIPSMRSEFKYSSVMQTPKVEKIVINAGIGKITKEKQKIDEAEKQISLISGQKPIIAKAKKSISGFKIRAGMPVGLKATLRGERMYDFLDRMISIVFPRMRDFSGISKKSLDENGNISIGIKDSSVFPELSGIEAGNAVSMEVTITVSSNSKIESERLLAHLGFPFRKDNK